MKVKFTASVLKFDKQGEKTGWTYIEVPAKIARQLKQDNKKSFRVKGKLDNFSIKKTALLPMGDGNFILPLNAKMRKRSGKHMGSTLIVQLEEDNNPLLLNMELMACLADEPGAIKFFNQLPKSHQYYFSKWIESAQTDSTKAKRIANTVTACLKKQGFPQMMRSLKEEKNRIPSSFR